MSRNETVAFYELLYVNSLRGDDATGVCAIYKNRDVAVLKDSIPSAEFLNTKEYIDMHNDFIRSGRALLGHNRKKTMGLNRPVDAHPYVVNKDKVFMHNGTLTNHKALADTAVDSEALGIHLTSYTNTEDLEEKLGKVQGAYAVVWYDQATDKVHILRNKERPLWLAISKNGDIAYASEAWMLWGALSRNNIPVESVKEVPVNTLLTIDLKANTLTVDEQELTIKKAQPPYTGGTTSAKKDGRYRVVTTTATHLKATATETEVSYTLSKNAFKRYMKDVVGQYVTFFGEDACYAPSKDPKDNLIKIKGSDDEEPHITYNGEFRHTLSSNETLDWFCGRMFSGRVAYGEYNRISGKINITVVEVKLINGSQEKTNAHQTALH
jgi:hypothetical protein